MMSPSSPGEAAAAAKGRGGHCSGRGAWRARYSGPGTLNYEIIMYTL
jgi:hypothetical protein